MELYPAIDLRQGRVVRLSQGEAARLTAYDSDPLAVAERFIEAGAEWLHVVDLDQAFGDGDNEPVVRALVAAVNGRASVQLGGGVRSLARVEALAELDVARLVIGTAAVTAPAFLADAVSAVGSDRLAVGIDARQGFVALRGWTDTTNLRAEELAAQVIEAGVRTMIYTDIERDGMLSGPDLDGAMRLQGLGARVIASGGVSSLDDLTRAARAGVQGVIVGRALYEGHFSLREALDRARRGAP